MGINAFVMRYWDEDDPFFFTKQFLASRDFTDNVLKDICRDIDIPIVGNSNDKLDRVERITEACRDNADVQDVVVRNLVARRRKWAAIKFVDNFTPVSARDPKELLVTGGQPEWYGPIEERIHDDAYWYIRPFYIRHYEETENEDEIREVLIRWLCFARLGQHLFSVHWRGFTYSEGRAQATRSNSQFPYWRRIPDVITEIEELTAASTVNIDLHQLILYDLWEQYRRNPEYQWIDRRIRAEMRGVAMSARGGAVVEVEIGGLTQLAQSLQEAVTSELEDNSVCTIEDTEIIDDVILETLIRDVGPLSYEFSLKDNEDRKIVRMHSYFGAKKYTTSSDAFPHIRIYTSWGDDLNQLRFLIAHIAPDELPESGGNDEDNREREQVRLFWK